MDSIIFDVDGTLWNSTGIVAKAWENYLRNVEQIELPLTAEIIASMFGQPLPDIAKQIFPDASREEQLRLIDRCCNAEHEALLKECAPLYEDLEKALQLLAEKYPLYIVSNCEAGYIEVFLEATGFGKYFKGHLCNGDNNLDKGSNISLIARTYDMKSPVYVGDTMGDSFPAARLAFRLSLLPMDSEMYRNRMRSSVSQWISSIFFVKKYPEK